jgi:hypothetical protein
MANNYEPRPESEVSYLRKFDQEPGHDPEVRPYMGGKALGDLLRSLGPMDSVPAGLDRVDDRSAEGSSNTVRTPRGAADAAPAGAQDQAQGSGPVPTPADRGYSANFRFGSIGTVDPRVDVDRSNVQGQQRGQRADQRRAEVASGPPHGPWYTAAGDKCPACRAENGTDSGKDTEPFSVLPRGSVEQ